MLWSLSMGDSHGYERWMFLVQLVHTLIAICEYAQGVHICYVSMTGWLRRQQPFHICWFRDNEEVTKEAIIRASVQLKRQTRNADRDR